MLNAVGGGLEIFLGWIVASEEVISRDWRSVERGSKAGVS